MIPKGLVTQIGMIALAVGIFFTYVKPTLVLVQANQEDIAHMREEREKVTAVNNHLDELYQRAQSIDPVEYQKLTTYLPRTVDSVAVQRDIMFIAEEAGVTLTTLSGDEKGAAVKSKDEAEQSNESLKQYSFKIAFSDSYENIKKFLTLVEHNDYPLQVAELTLAGAEGSSDDKEKKADTTALPVSMTLVTYALALSSTTPSVE